MVLQKTELKVYKMIAIILLRPPPFVLRMKIIRRVSFSFGLLSATLEQQGHICCWLAFVCTCRVFQKEISSDLWKVFENKLLFFW